MPDVVKTIEELLASQLPAAPEGTCTDPDAAAGWPRWDKFNDGGHPWRN